MAHRITEIKSTLDGKQHTFDCELVHHETGEAVIAYRMPRDLMLEDIALRKGTLSLGYFWERRPYNVYHWIDDALDTVALYFNIADNTRIGSREIEWRDLSVDVLINPAGECRVLDEDELPVDLDAGLLAYIHSARDELCRRPLSLLNEYDKLTRSLVTRG